MHNFPAWARFLFKRRRVLYSLAWLLVISLAVGRFINGRHCFRDPNRADGNYGHSSIDFGGQWLMGRTLASGHGRELYYRPRLWEVATRAYPPDQEAPGDHLHDPQILIDCFMGSDEPPGIGGALYPPINAFFMLPFALGDHPARAYFAMQCVQLLLCFIAGLGVSRLSGGRFWWPLASSLILVYPGCRGVIDLGQNGALSLTILIWGWLALRAAGRCSAARVGRSWLTNPCGRFSFLLMLLLIRQWRAALTMAAAGVGLVLATLPFVGLQSWFHWLAIGQDAALIYNVDANWVPLSRDLLGIPRRLFVDFTISGGVPAKERDNLLAMAASWGLWAIVVEITLPHLFIRRPPTRPVHRPHARVAHSGDLDVYFPFHVLRCPDFRVWPMRPAGRSAAVLQTADL